ERQRSALTRNPELEDARSALAGCLTGLMYLSKNAENEKRTAILKEGVAALKALSEKSAPNPRSLWILGGNQAFAPPPYGGDAVRATATFRRGLEAGRAEALGAAGRDPWIPAWGGPEILMSLAYLNAFGPAPNPAVARAYAEGALSMVPDWHYVR